MGVKKQLLSIQERLELMRSQPMKLRKRGQASKESVEAMREIQRKAISLPDCPYNAADIIDCADGLQQLKLNQSQCTEVRLMTWEDHISTRYNQEYMLNERTRQTELTHQREKLSHLNSRKEKWDMAIELGLCAYLEDAFGKANSRLKKSYFMSDTLLHRACSAIQNVQLIKLLISMGANLAAYNQFGKTVYHITAENCWIELFDELLTNLDDKSAAIILALDNTGQSILHCAAANGSACIVDSLLHIPLVTHQLSSIINLQTPLEGYTALHIAAKNGHVNCVKRLLAISGVEWSIRDKAGLTALLLAFEQTFNIDELIQTFLDTPPSPPNEINAFHMFDINKGQNCLHIAILKRFRNVSHALIYSNRVPLDSVTSAGGKSPLHLAVACEDLGTVQVLLECNVIVDMVDNDGQTPLLQACVNGNLEIIQSLINAGASVAHQNHQAQSALHYLSAYCRDRELIELLVQRGADVFGRTLKLNTPLHFAAMYGNEVAAQVLLAHGASSSEINEDRRSVIYLAKKWRHRKVEELMKPHINPGDSAIREISSSSVRNNQVDTPQLLSRPQHSTIHSLKVHYGAQTYPVSYHTSSSSYDHGSESIPVFILEDDTDETPTIVVPEIKELNLNNMSHTSFSQYVMEQQEKYRNREINHRHSHPVKLEPISEDVSEKSLPKPYAKYESIQCYHNLTFKAKTKRKRFLDEPIEIPWEITLPNSTMLMSCNTLQRHIKPSINESIGDVRDYFAPSHLDHWVKEEPVPRQQRNIQKVKQQLTPFQEYTAKNKSFAVVK